MNQPQNRLNEKKSDAGSPESAKEKQKDQSASSRATERAKAGEPLSPDDRGKRSPKQENL